jgi:hypothetical protein
VDAASQEFALLSTSALAPPEREVIAEPLMGYGVAKPLAAAQPGSGEGQDAAAPWLHEAGRVMGAAAGHPPDGALLNDLLDGVLQDGL